MRYLASAKVSKEDIARRHRGRRWDHQGLVCVLTSVEPCRSFEIYRDRETKHLQLQPRVRKCLFLYHYAVHPVFGFLNARIQTWFPFSIQICLNGREWLAHQMDPGRAGLRAHDNCFPWIEDWPTAQQLMDQQLRVDWPTLLDDIAGTLNPIHDQIFQALSSAATTGRPIRASGPSTSPSARAEELRRLYPRLLQHAITTFGSTDVMRFLGRRIPLSGADPASASLAKSSAICTSGRKACASSTASTATPSSCTTRPSPSWAACCVPKARSTDVARLSRVSTQGRRPARASWPGVRYAAASPTCTAVPKCRRKATERYLDALASVDEDTTLDDVLHRLGQPTVLAWSARARAAALRTG